MCHTVSLHYTYMSVCSYTHMSVRTYTYTHVSDVYMCLYIHTCIYCNNTYTCVCVYICIHMCLYTYTCVCAYNVLVDVTVSVASSGTNPLCLSKPSSQPSMSVCDQGPWEGEEGRGSCDMWLPFSRYHRHSE